MLQALLLAVDREVRRINEENPNCPNPFGLPQDGIPFPGLQPASSFLFQHPAAPQLQPQDPVACAVAARNAIAPIASLQSLGFAGHQGLLCIDPNGRSQLQRGSELLWPGAAEAHSNKCASDSSDTNSSDASQGSANTTQRVCRPIACRPTLTAKNPLGFAALTVGSPSPVDQQPPAQQPCLKPSLKRCDPVSSASPSASPPSSPSALSKKRKTACAVEEPVSSRYCSQTGGTSTFRGVSWHSQTCKWKSQIKVNGRDVNLGRHKDESDAAKAYDRAAICARGVECARLNFPISEYASELEYLSSIPLAELASVLRGVEERLQQQTSRYHGVRLNKRTNKWEAYIRISGKHVHLGCYDSEAYAAQAFDQAAIVRHTLRLGAAATKTPLVTNFPQDTYTELQHRLLKVGLGRTLVRSKSAAMLAAAEAACLVHQLQNKYMVNLLQRCMEDTLPSA